MNLKPVKDQVIVITGASSGIGLATAIEAARQGARLVIASRDDEDLEAAAQRLRTEQAEVEAVAVDVADRAGMEYLAQQAEARFGGFDTWINNAGASAYGRLAEVPTDDARQVFETNYWGVVHGSLVAAERFRKRNGNYAGCLINIGSVLSDRAVPLQGHYAASKHAVKGFTDALRMELEKEGVPVVVTLVKPSAINTPYPEHAASYMEAAPTVPPPVYAPEVVARALVAVSARPTREITVGAGGRALALMGQLAPRLTDKVMEATMFDLQQREDRPARQDEGHLQEPLPDGGAHVHGEAPRHVLQTSAYTWAKLNPIPVYGTALAVGLGAVLALRR
jgi:short-subunit dehydrogenase